MATFFFLLKMREYGGLRLGPGCESEVWTLKTKEVVVCCNFFLLLFLGFYRNCVLLIIWLLDVQHRLGQAHIRSMWRTGSFSLSLSHSHSLPQSFDVHFMRVCVCVLNFYDFIIPYFKPFVHCSSTSSSIEILWGVLLWVLSGWAEKMEPESDKSMCLYMDIQQLSTSQLFDRFGSAPLTSLI